MAFSRALRFSSDNLESPASYQKEEKKILLKVTTLDQSPQTCSRSYRHRYSSEKTDISNKNEKGYNSNRNSIDNKENLPTHTPCSTKVRDQVLESQGPSLLTRPKLIHSCLSKPINVDRSNFNRFSIGRRSVRILKKTKSVPEPNNDIEKANNIQESKKKNEAKLKNVKNESTTKSNHHSSDDSADSNNTYIIEKDTPKKINAISDDTAATPSKNMLPKDESVKQIYHKDIDLHKEIMERLESLDIRYNQDDENMKKKFMESLGCKVVDQNHDNKNMEKSFTKSLDCLDVEQKQNEKIVNNECTQSLDGLDQIDQDPESKLVDTWYYKSLLSNRTRDNASEDVNVGPSDRSTVFLESESFIDDDYDSYLSGLKLNELIGNDQEKFCAIFEAILQLQISKQSTGKKPAVEMKGNIKLPSNKSKASKIRLRRDLEKLVKQAIEDLNNKFKREIYTRTETKLKELLSQIQKLNKEANKNTDKVCEHATKALVSKLEELMKDLY